MFVIYIAEFPNGKFYIGKSKDFNDLNKKEIEFIIKYDSIKNGYNTSTGGDGGDTISNNPRRYDGKQPKNKSI
jgi:hypothetical protein